MTLFEKYNEDGRLDCEDVIEAVIESVCIKDCECLKGHYDVKASESICSKSDIAEETCKKCWNLNYIEDYVPDINVGSKNIRVGTKWREKKKEYTEINREHLNEMQRMRCKVHCKICGERIIHHEPIHKPRMHEQCIINSCLDTKRKGEKLTKLQYTRLYAIGYTVADINEMLSEECLK